ncbi:DUF4832 domain-containing protein [Thalassoglobus polymorphus]|uniref:DUF4832 domain-containing protein n=1 Tax=Thalassoglobus polymorphus TaxID=2527994 RepID=A0A517QNL5_9PLAN|nr:DUF4832 domain-containing protein [Thalassoglobus polymorphus]QDT33221.1 hypothetical protein Mal48_24740 [Thalassoglobus polymorphus]
MKTLLPAFSVLLGIVPSLCFSAPASSEEIVVRPQSKAGPLDNPLKGWAPYTDAGKIHQPYSMVFQYISWRELEPVQGDFRFDEWEKAWEVERANGKHIIFRVYVDYPSLPSGLPDWLRKAGVKETAYEEHGGGMSPDYNDPLMISAMERLIEALGKRYNKNPRVAFIQLGLLGFWGEWHTWPRDELYATPETERRIIDAYQKSFPDKSLMVRYARGYAGQQDWIGFHDDMFPQDTDNGKDWSFLSGLRKTKRTENWRVAVVGGEMVPNKARQWLGKDYETTLTMLDRSHFSWVGPYCPALEKSNDETFLKRSEELVRKMGYEFQITEVVHPAEVSAKQSSRFSLEGRNIGTAPFYYPWLFEWALLDSSGKVVKICKTEWDIRKWTPGDFSEESKLTFQVPAGAYRLGVGIRDPWLDRPAIRFASELPVVDGWTIVSMLKVTE